MPKGGLSYNRGDPARSNIILVHIFHDFQDKIPLAASQWDGKEIAGDCMGYGVIVLQSTVRRPEFAKTRQCRQDRR